MREFPSSFKFLPGVGLGVGVTFFKYIFGGGGGGGSGQPGNPSGYTLASMTDISFLYIGPYITSCWQTRRTVRCTGWYTCCCRTLQVFTQLFSYYFLIGSVNSRRTLRQTQRYVYIPLLAIVLGSGDSGQWNILWCGRLEVIPKMPWPT